MPPSPIGPAAPGDLPGVLDLLQRSGLPTEGVAEHFASAVVARVGEGVVGSAVVELYADGALLRSVAVAPHVRGAGLGHALTAAALALAAERGAAAAYLLTTTAADFFPRLGFERVSREAVPPGVASSPEFTHVCPSSAAVLARPLGDAAPLAASRPYPPPLPTPLMNVPPTPEALRGVVREKYAEIALAGQTAGPTSCCGPACGCDGGTGVPVAMAEDYTALAGYVPDADLGLGCGLPTEHAGLAPGDTVLDLGSGAGNDAFVARAVVGEAGRVIGVDMTPEMVAKARRNAAALGFSNVEFRLGEIEALPVEAGSVDVVVSNCVLNLVPEKGRAFAETYRVLKPGGHFCVSDVVARGALPEAARHVAELYAGCVSGAVDEAEYLAGLRAAGFAGVRVVKAREIALPDEALAPYLSAEDRAALRASGAAVVSVTVVGTKPERGVGGATPAGTEGAAGACCGPGCC